MGHHQSLINNLSHCDRCGINLTMFTDKLPCPPWGVVKDEIKNTELSPEAELIEALGHMVFFFKELLYKSGHDEIRPVFNKRFIESQKKYLEEIIQKYTDPKRL